jgi:hypothetical protein
MLRSSSRAVGALLTCALLACASSIPKAELDRCKLGVADGNDAYTVRQGAACGVIAKRLLDDDQPLQALEYARKACDLEDARGCGEYLTLVRQRPALGPDELRRARTEGEKACAGMVVGESGTDGRPEICEDTAELYEVDPRSLPDAARLYGRACKLGLARTCAHAKSLGGSDVVEEDEPRPREKKTASAPPPPPMPTLPPPRPVLPVPPPPPRGPSTLVDSSCHDMRECVSLELRQRNITEVVGTMVSHCDKPVVCKWCPAKAQQPDKNACRQATLAPGETRSGTEGGLWYDGYDSMGYDCTAVGDSQACLGI